MRPNGIIYQSNRSKSFGEYKIHFGFGKRMAYHFLRAFGAGLVAFAITGIIFSFWPIIRSEFLYRFGSKNQIRIDKFAGINGVSLASELKLDPYFSLYIPKINAKSKIIPNVDPGNSADYLAALTHGIAHAKGTSFPGQGGTIYLFSHSTDSPINIARYNAEFYLLGKLEKGDEITVFFLNQIHKYEVVDEFTTAADDTKWLEKSSAERLVLQTCDPPGTSWRRLIVVAKPTL